MLYFWKKHNPLNIETHVQYENIFLFIKLKEKIQFCGFIINLFRVY